VKPPEGLIPLPAGGFGGPKMVERRGNLFIFPVRIELGLLPEAPMLFIFVILLIQRKITPIGLDRLA